MNVHKKGVYPLVEKFVINDLSGRKGMIAFTVEKYNLKRYATHK